MVDQYPFEGYTDVYPDTMTTPDWFGFGHKHFDQRTSPVRHVVYADGSRQAVIQLNCGEENTCVGRQIMDRIKGGDAERPHINLQQGMGYQRTPGAGHWGDGMFQLPDTRPGRHHRPDSF